MTPRPSLLPLSDFGLSRAQLHPGQSEVVQSHTISSLTLVCHLVPIHQKHLNNLCVVDFSDDDGGELSLCLDDIHLDNFQRDRSGQLFALDFGKTNFLLPWPAYHLQVQRRRGLEKPKARKSFGDSKSKTLGGLKDCWLASAKVQ